MIKDDDLDILLDKMEENENEYIDNLYDYTFNMLFTMKDDWKKQCQVDGYIQIPDRFLYAIINSNLTSNEKSVLLYLIRRIKCFVNATEIKLKDIINATGILKSNIQNPLNGLKNKNIISKDKSGYILNTDILSWNCKQDKGIENFISMKANKKSINNIKKKLQIPENKE